MFLFIYARPGGRRTAESRARRVRVAVRGKVGSGGGVYEAEEHPCTSRVGFFRVKRSPPAGKSNTCPLFLPCQVPTAQLKRPIWDS